MSLNIRIEAGQYRDEDSRVVEIHNEVFNLIKPFKSGTKGGYVVVDGAGRVPSKPHLRVKVEASAFTLEDGEGNTVEGEVILSGNSTPVVAEPKVIETDEEAIERIRKSFAVLDQMGYAVADGVVRGLIISGPPGVGKSFGIEAILDGYTAGTKLSGLPSPVEIVKGSTTAIGLYQTLYNNSSRGNVVLFDDCDTLFGDMVALGLLKAVLDTSEKRHVSWKGESHALKREGIPDSFDFKGGVIFITNMNFDTIRSKTLEPHLAALQSRCHYIDVEIYSTNDKILRIKQVVGDGMLDRYNFTPVVHDRIVNFIIDNVDNLRELSLRTVIKVSDLAKAFPDTWEETASYTVFRKRR